MSTGGYPSSFRWSRFVSLSLGAVAVVMLSMFPYGDWVYDEWELSAIETSTIVGAALAWLLALVLTLRHRAPRAVVVLAACPTFLAIYWFVFAD